MVKRREVLLNLPWVWDIVHDGLFLAHCNNFCLYCCSPHPKGFGGLHTEI